LSYSSRRMHCSGIDEELIMEQMIICLKDLVGVVDDHIAHATRTRDKDGRVEPSVSLVASLECEMETHPELIRTDFAFSQLFQNFLLSCSCSVQVLVYPLVLL
jgi:hypothetical protein